MPHRLLSRGGSPWLFALTLLVVCGSGAQAQRLEDRVAPPEEFRRIPMPPQSFGAYLRGLRLLPGHPPVRLYDGSLKRNQSAHAAVFDLDVGKSDLQQCADAVIRVRAEYLRGAGREAEICFRFTSGHAAPWSRWRKGERPVLLSGNRVIWRKLADPDSSGASFRRYLDKVFEFAGTSSLSRELLPVSSSAPVRPGDVFIQGGHPGHAVLVVDVVENGVGEQRFLLAQSYMPAQQFQLLRNPADPSSPWYRPVPARALLTPEWTFSWTDRRRFGKTCSQENARENRG